MFDKWTGPEIATFWIAIGAAVVAVFSLGWQVWTWSRSGAVVRVKVGLSLPLYGSGSPEWHIGVSASNRGRGAATVEGWGLRVPGADRDLVPSAVHWSSPLPFTLEPGGAAGSWHVPTDIIIKRCHEIGIEHQKLKAWVRLSDGRRVYVKRRGIGIK